MKYLIFFLMLITLASYSDNNKHDHHDEHKHNHEHETKEKKSLKAHEHGIGVLNIAQENNMFVFEFELPGFDVVGFEYTAKKKEDIKKVKQAINTLSDYSNMIEINDGARCEEKSSKVDLLKEGNHTEFRSKYILSCSNINEISKIVIKYFQNFKNGKKLNVNIVSEKGSESLELLSINHVIKVKDYF